jgi:hypothetical protein
MLLSLVRTPLPQRERLTAAWFGPKGFASVVYGLLALQSGIAERELLFDLVGVTIALSIVLHSSTDVPVARMLRIEPPDELPSGRPIAHEPPDPPTPSHRRHKPNDYARSTPASLVPQCAALSDAFVGTRRRDPGACRFRNRSSRRCFE